MIANIQDENLGQIFPSTGPSTHARKIIATNVAQNSSQVSRAVASEKKTEAISLLKFLPSYLGSSWEKHVSARLIVLRRELTLQD